MARAVFFCYTTPYMETMLPEPKRWYARWWGLLLLVAGSLCLLFFGLVLVITVRYWWQLKHGEQPAFIQEHYSRFTQIGAKGSSKKMIDRAQLETADDPFLGRPGAPIVIVEFIDFKCPNSKIAAPIMKQVIQKYGYAVKYIVRDFPPESVRPGSTKLSELVGCASQQSRFWEMHDLLFLEQSNLPETLTDRHLEVIALQAGVDLSELKVCLADEAVVREVKQDYLDGAQFGIAGTPTFFVNGERVEGVVPFETWQSYLDQVIAKSSAK